MTTTPNTDAEFHDAGFEHQSDNYHASPASVSPALATVAVIATTAALVGAFIGVAIAYWVGISTALAGVAVVAFTVTLLLVGAYARWGRT